MSYIEVKYINLLAPTLQQFRKRGENLWNFRCPICNDSAKDNLKARGYIYHRKGSYSFYCHNCHATLSLPKFLKRQSHYLYQEYLLESFGAPKDEDEAAEFVTKPVFRSDEPLKKLPSIDDLDPKHTARRFIEDRLIPKDRWKDIYYADDFKAAMDELIPDHGKKLYTEPRVVLPFFDPDGLLLGVQGRVLTPESKVRYITLKTNEANAKVYGWDKVDGSKTITVVEGPLDSLFLYTAIATMDAALWHIPSVVGLDNNYVFVYDNECRNSQIVSNMRKTIAAGYRMCVWPADFEHKDINDAVKAGLNPSLVQHIIDQNTFTGLEATMKLNQWSRI